MNKKLIAAATWSTAYNGNTGALLSVYEIAEDEEPSDAAEIQTIEIGKSVSSMTVDHERSLLFVCCETNYHNECSPGGEIRVYHINRDKQENILELSGIYHSYGAFPIGIHPSRDHLVVLNHGSNLTKACVTKVNDKGEYQTEFVGDEASLIVLSRDEYGMPLKPEDRYVFSGCGSIPFFQDSPAPHDLYYSESEELYYVPMRGTDETRVFCVNNLGKITLSKILKNEPGTGPRNASFIKSSGVSVIVSEIEPCVTVFNGEKNIGSLTTISDDYQTDEPKYSFSYPHPSGILVNDEKKKLYTITRSPDLLTVYDIGNNSELKKIQIEDAAGVNPRQMILSGESLYVVCLGTNNIIGWQLDDVGSPIRHKVILNGHERLAFCAFL